jgi:hypothetical protein
MLKSKTQIVVQKTKIITTIKDHNNTGGGLLIYFKDHISVERVTGLQNDVDDLGDHAHHFNPSKSYFPSKEFK